MESPQASSRLNVGLFRHPATLHRGFPGGSVGKESACNVRGPASIPESERSPGEGHGNPLQWRIPWTEEPGGLLSRWKSVRQDSAAQQEHEWIPHSTVEVYSGESCHRKYGPNMDKLLAPWRESSGGALRFCPKAAESKCSLQWHLQGLKAQESLRSPEHTVSTEWIPPLPARGADREDISWVLRGHRKCLNALSLPQALSLFRGVRMCVSRSVVSNSLQPHGL